MNSSNKITQTQLYKLLEQQQFKCALTGQQLTPETSGIDHIVPVKLGGENNIENVQWVLKDINRMKSTLTVQAFIENCRKVVNWADRTS